MFSYVQRYDYTLRSDWQYEFIMHLHNKTLPTDFVNDSFPRLFPDWHLYQTVTNCMFASVSFACLRRGTILDAMIGLC